VSEFVPYIDDTLTEKGEEKRKRKNTIVHHQYSKPHNNNTNMQTISNAPYNTTKSLQGRASTQWPMTCHAEIMQCLGEAKLSIADRTASPQAI